MGNYISTGFAVLMEYVNFQLRKNYVNNFERKRREGMKKEEKGRER